MGAPEPFAVDSVGQVGRLAVCQAECAMGSPAFFRAEDGTLGVVSSQNNATGAIYVWDGKGDGATFTNERAITVTDSSMVTNPRIVYDAASKGYKVFWTDGRAAKAVWPRSPT